MSTMATGHPNYFTQLKDAASNLPWIISPDVTVVISIYSSVITGSALLSSTNFALGDRALNTSGWDDGGVYYDSTRKIWIVGSGDTIAISSDASVWDKHTLEFTPSEEAKGYLYSCVGHNAIFYVEELNSFFYLATQNANTPRGTYIPYVFYSDNGTDWSQASIDDITPHHTNRSSLVYDPVSNVLHMSNPHLVSTDGGVTWTKYSSDGLSICNYIYDSNTGLILSGNTSGNLVANSRTDYTEWTPVDINFGTLEGYAVTKIVKVHPKTEYDLLVELRTSETSDVREFFKVNTSTMVAEYIGFTRTRNTISTSNTDPIYTSTCIQDIPGLSSAYFCIGSYAKLIPYSELFQTKEYVPDADDASINNILKDATYVSEFMISFNSMCAVM